jgi:ADP-ribosylglycohydrolase
MTHPELSAALEIVAAHLRQGSGASELTRALAFELGVSGYVVHTVPASLFCWLRSLDDFRRAIEDVVGLGGDTDTTGAIVGGLAGATLGAEAIPAQWLDGLLEWPRSVAWMRRLAGRLSRRFPAPAATADNDSCGPLSLFWPGLALRNPAFMLIVLAHGLRRTLPPY